jgi:hypothetical protein
MLFDRPRAFGAPSVDASYICWSAALLSLRNDTWQAIPDSLEWHPRFSIL